MPMDLRCTKYDCRIEVFKGETYVPFNTCPGCSQTCSPSYYSTPTPAPIATPVYVPSPPTPAMIEEAVNEDVTQVLNNLRDTLELRAHKAKADGDPDYARGFFHSRNVVDVEIAKYGTD